MTKNKDFKIILNKNHTSAKDVLLKQSKHFNYRYSRGFIEYYKIYESNFRKLNFFYLEVFYKNDLYLFVPIFVYKRKLYNHEDKLYPPIFKNRLELETLRNLIIIYFNFLKNNYKSFEKYFVIYEEKNKSLNYYNNFIKKKYKFNYHIEEFIVNLKLDIRVIKNQFRKSIKSLVNLKSNEKIIFFQSNITDKVFKKFKNIHFINNGMTRSNDTWNKQYKNLKMNRSILYAMKVNEEFISFAYFEISEQCIYYSVSSSNKEYKNHMPGHKIIFFAINNFLNKKKFLLLGESDSKYDNMKKNNINFFKKAFSKLIIKKKIYS